jgi:hypothetical protein
MDPTQLDGQTRDAEIEAIKQVVATVQHAQQTNSSRSSWACSGLTRSGPPAAAGACSDDEITAFTRQVLPGGMKGLTVTFEVVHVLFIRVDVAAVKVRQLYASTNGQPSDEEGEGTPLLVMSKEDGQWCLVACQNTGVLES